MDRWPARGRVRQRTAGFRTSHGAADVLAAGIACFLLWPMIHGPRTTEKGRASQLGKKVGFFLEKNKSLDLFKVILPSKQSQYRDITLLGLVWQHQFFK